LPVACFGFDKEGRIVLWNKEATKLYGYEKSQAIGKLMTEIISKEKEPEKVFGYINKIFEGRSFNRLQLKDISFDGQVRYVYNNSYPLFDLKGEIIMGISANIDITSLKTIQKELESSKHHLEKIMETPTSLIVELDRDLVIRRFNLGCEKSTGYSRNEVLGKCWIDLFVPDRLKQVTKTILNDVINQENTVLQREYESVIVSKYGKERVIFWAHSTITDENGNFVCLISIGKDITDRKRFQQRMSEGEKQYRFITESLPIHFAVVDESGKFILWNKYSEQMFGYSREEAIGKIGLKDIYESQQEADKVTEIASREGIFNQEITLLHKNGKRFPARLLVLPKKDDTGKIVGFYGFAEDISAQKEIRDQLMEEKTKYESLIMNIELGIFRTTLYEGGRFLEINPALVSMLGYESKEELMQIKVSDVYFDSPQRDLFLQEVVEKGSLRKEILLKRKNGTPFWAEVFVKAIKDSNQNVLYLDGIIKDISDQKNI